MLPNQCVTCQQPIRPGASENAVRVIARQLGHSRMYPRIYQLLRRLSLCTDCLQQLAVITGVICYSCGRQRQLEDLASSPMSWRQRISGEAQRKNSDSSVDTSLICYDCQHVPTETLCYNRSLLSYNNWAKELLYQYKYRGDERLADLCARMLAIAFLRFYRQSGINLITFVPVHPQRLAERGFNQAKQLATRLGTLAGLPVKALLLRSKHTEKLSKQAGRRSRQESMQDAFSPNPETCCHVRRMPLFGRKTRMKLLLVDDIYTTGSTIRSCAKVIRTIADYEQAEIYSITICR